MRLSKEPPFFRWLPHPLQITDGSKFKAEIIVEQLVMLELALGSIYLILVGVEGGGCGLTYYLVSRG